MLIDDLVFGAHLIDSRSGIWEVEELEDFFKGKVDGSGSFGCEAISYLHLEHFARVVSVGNPVGTFVHLLQLIDQVLGFGFDLAKIVVAFHRYLINDASTKRRSHIYSYNKH